MIFYRFALRFCYSLLQIALCFIAAIGLGCIILGFYIQYHNPAPDSEHLVCCAYNEDLKWLHRAAAHYDRIFIYIKNAERYAEVKKEFEEDNIIVLPFENIGSCDHIFLHHIIAYYDLLPSRITFTKGSNIPRKSTYFYHYLPIASDAPFIYKTIWDSPDLEQQKEGLKHFSMPYWDFRFNPGLHFTYQKSHYNNFESFLAAHFTAEQIHSLFKYARHTIIGGEFIVWGHNIKRYPRELYAALIDSHTPGPSREIDHFHERLWGLLFSSSIENPLEG